MFNELYGLELPYQSHWMYDSSESKPACILGGVCEFMTFLLVCPVSQHVQNTEASNALPKSMGIMEVEHLTQPLGGCTEVAVIKVIAVCTILRTVLLTQFALTVRHAKREIRGCDDPKLSSAVQSFVVIQVIKHPGMAMVAPYVSLICLTQSAICRTTI
jgi:hypothetical protein